MHYSHPYNSFPSIINVEVLRGLCPCKCRHCPVGITPPEKRRERFGEKHMDLTLFRKIIDEISFHPSATLRIHSVGEPLLWQDIEKGLRIARHTGVTSWLFTCGVTDNLALLQTVCELVDIVEISINSISPEDYRKTKGIDAFYKVVKNLEYMRSVIDINRFRTRLLTSRVESGDKQTDREFEIFWKASGIVDDAFVRSYHSYNHLMPSLNSRALPVKFQPCLVHWTRFNIGINGDAVVCFNDLFKVKLNDIDRLGSLHSENISTIWHGRKLNQIRRAELEDSYSRFFPGQPISCRKCTYRQPLHAKGTSEHQIEQLERENV